MRTTYHSLQIQVNSPRARVDDLLPGGAKSTMSAAQLLWREIDLEEPGPALLKQQRHLPPLYTEYTNWGQFALPIKVEE